MTASSIACSAARSSRAAPRLLGILDCPGCRRQCRLCGLDRARVLRLTTKQPGNQHPRRSFLDGGEILFSPRLFMRRASLIQPQPPKGLPNPGQAPDGSIVMLDRLG
jgi:hypothetical protein